MKMGAPGRMSAAAVSGQAVSDTPPRPARGNLISLRPLGYFMLNSEGPADSLSLCLSHRESC